ncbi:DUF4124 domain-containing protein [Pseudaeromonas sharmana]|uniref:DUF4124 domain-containing protein n=1 Tax=Pseudaeromonas sharmana TaxID=328412 RepID=A0ABV8CJS7_9GAMM
MMNPMPRHRLRLAYVLLLGLLAPAASADIYTCVNKSGVTAYQDRPCSATQQTQRHQTTDSQPERPMPRGGYASCEEMRVQIFEMEDGLDLVTEDLANFGWSAADLRAALQRCDLPTTVADYL